MFVTSVIFCLSANPATTPRYDVEVRVLEDRAGALTSAIDDLMRHHEELRGMCRRHRRPGSTGGQPTAHRDPGIIEFPPEAPTSGRRPSLQPVPSDRW